MKKRILFLFLLVFAACKKTNVDPPIPSAPFNLTSIVTNGQNAVRGNNFYNVNNRPSISLSFSAPIDRNAIALNIEFAQNPGSSISFDVNYANNDSTIIIQPSTVLKPITKYTLTITPALQSKQGIKLTVKPIYYLVTAIDSTEKFPVISDEALLTLIQKQTFKYFWDFGHPVSGMARERNTSGDLVTTGGTGFGVMSIIVGVERNFISREQGLQRVNLVVDFLKNKASRYHGAFAHWLNGASGETIPFSTQDNGADLVETSLLMQGLLTARQYFSGNQAEEILLRNNINSIYDDIDWNWFQNNQNTLFWHWSPNYQFSINQQIKGWNECLIAYVLAASSTTHTISKQIYDNGWASNGGFKNGSSYYNIKLPLGEPYGGPLFLSQYSFLGINPTNLSDAYADYFNQNQSHSLINYEYCVANPGQYNGYSSGVWGLTASDDNVKGYLAHSPTNDDGVISPTAAISAFPYTPKQSLDALHFFYYKLGDKLFKDYGFIDAFNLSDPWFPNSWLAIDQGPQIVMIENYRTGLLWNLFMSCPEIKSGMTKLGFQSPFL
ncbi:MAG: glucoamylase family protein [Ginsengibacter sp.]